MEDHKGNIRAETDMRTAGYQAVAESMCLGRMGAGKGALEKVTTKLKTDTCNAGYQLSTESLCLRRMGVGNGAPEKVASELKARHVHCRIPAID